MAAHLLKRGANLPCQRQLWRNFIRASSAHAAGGDILEKADKLQKWKIIEKAKIREFDIDGVLLEHERTGAKYLHLASQDSNNAFSVNFRTTPMDSTGVAHILEHTTLCGSQQYPVRDPFMKMLNRSLATFMNAMTGPDYTLYPFSTCNEQDFYNLMSVYLDAVYNPLLRELDFLQEGWRLENEDNRDEASQFVIKGVVYNEMKGAYSDSQQWFGQYLLNRLLPSHTYSHSSGGFPMKIPDLTWEALKKFHATHYHPSNTTFFTYGNIPLEKHIKKIDEYLDKFDRLAMDTSVPSESRWKEPRRAHLTCPQDPMSPNPQKQATVAVSYLLSDITDVKETFVLQVLCELLMSGPSSPLYKALIAQGHAADFSPVSGFDGHIRETTFTVGLQNIDPEQADKVINIIDETLNQVAEEGFPKERIEAVLHSYELGLKHRSGNFGLNLIMGMTAFCNHASNPFEYLRVNETLSWFNEQLKQDPEFLKKKIREYLINNTHKLVQTMTPDDKFSEEEAKMFNDLEDKLRSNMTEQDKLTARKKAQQLAELQGQPEDSSCLPTLHVSDIPDKVPRVELTHSQLAGRVNTQIAVQPTNQVSYFRALLDTSGVPSDLRPYLPLFASYLTKLGAGQLSYEEMDTQIELATGGLSASIHLAESPNSLESLHAHHILLSSHCLDRNIPRMFELWSMIFESLHLNNPDRVATLLKMDATQASNSIAHAGHSYAMGSSASNLNSTAALREMYSGMEHINMVSSLTGKLQESGAQDLLNKIKQIAEILLSGNPEMRCALNTVPESADKLTHAADRFFASLPQSQSNNNSDKSLATPVVEPHELKLHHVVPFPINFTAQSVPTVSYQHQDYAKLRVLAALMSSKFLHPEIREKGGAYGGGAVAGGGTFTFYSYRDPKNLETFSVYRQAGEWAVNTEHTAQDIEEAKLRVFQRLDEPVQPGYRGLRPFLTGVTDDIFSQHRDRIRDVSLNDLKSVASQYLVEPNVTGKTLIGPAQDGLSDLGWKVARTSQ